MLDVRNAAKKGMSWSALNALAGRSVTFVLGIVLARLLSPSDYGTVGMAAIFFALSGIVIDSGLGAALVRKPQTTDEDTSTMFFFNIGVSGLCAALICLFSNNIAEFFHSPILKDIVKVSALTMFIGSFGSIQWALCSKAIDFKTPAMIHLPTQIVTGLFSVALAYKGFGPWSLVLQSLLSTIISTSAIWFVSSWRPKLIFSFASIKGLIGFGGNLAVNSVLDKFYNEGVGMVIGKFYSPSDLGYYAKGQGTAQLPSTFIFNTVGGVLYPILAKIQDDDERLIRVYRRIMRMFTLLIFFLLMLMIALARPITIFLYSDRWIPAIIFMQVFCVRYMLYPVHAVNWYLLLAKGRSDWALKKEIFNKTVNFTCIGVGVMYGPIYIAAAMAVASILNIITNTWVSGKLFDFGFTKQCSDFIPYLILSILACIPAFALSFSALPSIVIVMLGGMISSALYFGYLYARKDENLFEFVRLTPLKKLVQSKGYLK